MKIGKRNIFTKNIMKEAQYDVDFIAQLWITRFWMLRNTPHSPRLP